MKKNIYVKSLAVDQTLIIELLTGFNPNIYDTEILSKTTVRFFEEFDEFDDDLDYSDFLDLLEMDGITDVKLFESMPFKVAPFLELEEELLKAFDVIKGRLFSINDLILYVFVLEDNKRVLSLLKEYIEDVATLEVETAKAFIKYNMNASMAAKKTYVHRNTFNYRLEKFIKNTGINIRDFKGSAAIFMILQLLDEYSI